MSERTKDGVQVVIGMLKDVLLILCLNCGSLFSTLKCGSICITCFFLLVLLMYRKIDSFRIAMMC